MFNRLFYSQIIFIVFFIAFDQFPQPISIYGGTTIITVVRNDTLWIGADSKAVGIKDGSVYTNCKIIPLGNVVFTRSGISQDSKGKFNIGDLFMYSYYKGNTIFETMKIFEDSLILKLKEIGNVVFTHFKNIEKLRVVNITTLFSFFIDDTLNMYLTHYGVSFDSTKSEIILDITPKHYVGNEVPVILGGKTSHIKNMWDFAIKGDIAKNIDYLIGVECEKESAFVGKPINIISLTKNGIKWIQQSKECQ